MRPVGNGRRRRISLPREGAGVGVLVSVERARELRSNASKPERRFWALLYSLRPAGHHFRRQVQTGPYYADFACHNQAPVIEIDGDTHHLVGREGYDIRRDAYLRSRGYLVLRLSNRDVMNNPEGVFEVVSGKLAALVGGSATPTPDPSPQGGGRRKHAALQGGRDV